MAFLIAYKIFKKFSDRVVDGSMMLKVSETRVLSMIVIADTDAVIGLLLPLVVIASDDILVIETIKICSRSNVHNITHNIKYAL